MDKYITIDWPYNRIVLDFERYNAERDQAEQRLKIEVESLRAENAQLKTQAQNVLTEEQWQALEHVERQLYASSSDYSFTSVNYREESQPLVHMWQQAQTYVENSVEATENVLTDQALMYRTARRVAQALGVIAFGAEWLLR